MLCNSKFARNNEEIINYEMNLKDANLIILNP